MNPFHRILVATDLTPHSKPALDEALELARGNGTELLIAYAYTPPNAAQAQSVGGGVYEEWDENLRSDVQSRLQALADNARQAGVTATPLILSGVPYEAISEAAREREADLVVMGTHTRKSVARFFLGSVVSRVISSAHCPVLAVPSA
jgi:nucleotide-binding universal stress UspA family protein